MIDIEKQIKYWVNGSLEDLETADWLVKGKRFKESLFFCHLSLEKILKSLLVKKMKDIPPRTHDLFILSNRSEIKLTDKDLEFLGILMRYQLEGRYPGNTTDNPTTEIASEYLERTKKLQSWLNQKL
jgi:HEPN domain-containing protein